MYGKKTTKALRMLSSFCFRKTNPSKHKRKVYFFIKDNEVDGFEAPENGGLSLDEIKNIAKYLSYSYCNMYPEYIKEDKIIEFIISLIRQSPLKDKNNLYKRIIAEAL